MSNPATPTVRNNVGDNCEISTEVFCYDNSFTNSETIISRT